MKFRNLFNSLNFKYFITISLILSIIFTLIFYFFYNLQKKRLLDLVHQKAEVVVDQIILTRKWLSDMQGVFVIKKDGIEPNQYLQKPEISCGDTTLVLKDPAIVTKELSEYSKTRTLYSFRLTSEHIINPANAPDHVEKKALKLFKDKNIDQYSTIETINNRKVFRLLKPLYVDNSCLGCHFYQGYSLGELRGCFSIFIPMDKVISDIEKMKLHFLIAGIFIILFTTILIYFVNYFLTIKPITSLTNTLIRFKENMNTEINFLKRDDEIGNLQRNFISMAERIKQNYHLMEDEIKKATSELKKKDKAKTDFLATISHELRTPLTTIQGGIEYLFKVTKRDENIEFLTIVDNNLKNLILMVNNLLDIAKIELGKLELNLEPVNIKELVQDALIFFKGYSSQKNISIKYENPFDYTIKIDKNRINQVLINIIHNAIKYSPENKDIIIQMSKSQTFFTLTVSNNTYSEISIQDVGKFFIKYKYFATGSQKGSGIGLATAKAIMEAHKGDIKVKIIDKQKISFELIFRGIYD